MYESETGNPVKDMLDTEHGLLGIDSMDKTKGLQQLADRLGINVIRFWKKVME
ncbi:hypothetical protein AALA98_16625 [Lachnospiraceae bacterium 45-W7]